MAAALEGLDVDPDATVTDLGSVKAPVLAELGTALGGRYVGGHPMCGTERSGHEATDPGLFTGARWALRLEPGTELPRDRKSVVEGKSEDFGGSRIIKKN